MEVVTPLEQLMMMLTWYDEFSDEFKLKCLREAMEQVISERGDNESL